MQGLSQDPALSPLPRVDVSSASFNLPIERGFQNFRGETTAVSVRSLMVGQGCAGSRLQKLKGTKAQAGRVRMFGLQRRKGTLWAMEQPTCVSRGERQWSCCSSRCHGWPVLD